jgi:hypothetical protein
MYAKVSSKIICLYNIQLPNWAKNEIVPSIEFLGIELYCHMQNNQNKCGWLLNSSPDLSFLYSGTRHKFDGNSIKFGSASGPYSIAYLVSQYWLEQQRQRVADKAFPERIAKQVGG